MIINKYYILVSLLSIGQFAFSQKDSLLSDDYFQSSEMVDMIDNALIEFHKEVYSTSNHDSLIAVFGYEDGDVPTFSDSIYCARLEELNLKSPFHLDCNEDVLKTIQFFAKKRRYFTSVTIGRSALYFDMYEEKLAKHDMPLELKYLSVIESGLRPQVKSRAGALGLWQFMYRTGKIYGLEETSYIDQRMDPELATEAACRYLKKLHSMYDDWNMALAAYNAGPGNVNKAIRRSGGKMTYWEIRPYLPRETQGYVPNFIAMSYMMNYHTEHNIQPIPPKVYDFELDTVCLKTAVNMETIDTLIGWNVEDIQFVNPIYKTTYIPKTNPKQCINIPTYFLNDWISCEDSLYKLDSALFIIDIDNDPELEALRNQKKTETHTVRSGESLSVIASRYGTTVNEIMRLNNLRSTRLRVGQKLKVSGKAITEKKTSSTSSSTSSSNSKTYTIKSGDNLWAIAKRHNTSVAELQRLNPNINHDNLKVGQKIKLK